MSTDFRTAVKPVCHCLNVSADEIETSVKLLGCSSLGEVMQCTGAGTGCTACQRRVQGVINRAQCESQQDRMPAGFAAVYGR